MRFNFLFDIYLIFAVNFSIFQFSTIKRFNFALCIPSSGLPADAHEEEPDAPRRCGPRRVQRLEKRLASQSECTERARASFAGLVREAVSKPIFASK